MCGIRTAVLMVLSVHVCATAVVFVFFWWRNVAERPRDFESLHFFGSPDATLLSAISPSPTAWHPAKSWTTVSRLRGHLHKRQAGALGLRCKCTPQRKRKLHLEQHHSFIHSLQLFEPLSTNRCRLKPCNTTDKTLILLEEPTRATIARTFAQNHRSRVGVQFTLKVSLIRQ